MGRAVADGAVTGDTDWAMSKNQSLADMRVNRMDAEAEGRIYRALRHFCIRSAPADSADASS